MYYIYVIKSKLKNWLYIGFTSDLRERFYEHNKGKVKVTKATEERGDTKLRRSKYTTLAEKKMKELVGKEIPLFLVIGALKIR